MLRGDILSTFVRFTIKATAKGLQVIFILIKNHERLREIWITGIKEMR